MGGCGVVHVHSGKRVYACCEVVQDTCDSDTHTPSYVHPHMYTLICTPSHTHSHMHTLICTPSHVHPHIIAHLHKSIHTVAQVCQVSFCFPHRLQCRLTRLGSGGGVDNGGGVSGRGGTGGGVTGGPTQSPHLVSYTPQSPHLVSQCLDLPRCALLQSTHIMIQQFHCCSKTCFQYQVLKGGLYVNQC